MGLEFFGGGILVEIRGTGCQRIVFRFVFGFLGFSRVSIAFWNRDRFGLVFVIGSRTPFLDRGLISCRVASLAAVGLKKNR